MMRASRPRPSSKIGVRQLRLRLLHARLETAIDTDLDEPHEGDDVMRDARHELVQRRGRARVVVLAEGHFGDGVQTRIPGFRRFLGEPAAERNRGLARVGSDLKRLDDRRTAFEVVTRHEFDLGEGQPQRRAPAAGLWRQILACAVELLAREVRDRQVSANLHVLRIDRRDLGEDIEHVVGTAGLFERR